jgi:hypothetical protein
MSAGAWFLAQDSFQRMQPRTNNALKDYPELAAKPVEELIAKPARSNKMAILPEAHFGCGANIPTQHTSAKPKEGDVIQDPFDITVQIARNASSGDGGRGSGNLQTSTNFDQCPFWSESWLCLLLSLI